jgi:hypothetical protein
MTEDTIKKRKPSCLARGLAGTLAFLFVLTLPFVLLIFNIGRMLFHQPTVKRVLTHELIRSDLIPVVLEWFSDTTAQERVESGEARTWVEEPDIVQLMSFLDRDGWREIRAEVLTDEMVNDWAPQLVGGFYDWIDSDELLPQASLDLDVLMTRVNSDHGVNSIVIAYDELPPCTQEEIDDFEGRLADAAPGVWVFYNLCEFPDPYHEDQFNDYVESLTDLVEEVPGEFVLADAIQRSPDYSPQGWKSLKTQLRTLKLVSRWGWVLPAVILLLILALAVRSAKGLGNWWGIPMVLGGLLSLPLALFYQRLLASLFTSPLGSAVPKIVRAEAARATGRILAVAFRQMMFQAIAVAVIGFILFVIGEFVGPGEEAEVLQVVDGDLENPQNGAVEG